MRSRMWKSLLLIALPCVLLGTSTALAHKDRIQYPESIGVGDGRSTFWIVSYPPNRMVRFTVGPSKNVTAITVQLGKSTFRVPPETCAKIHAVEFDTVCLLWDGTKASPADAAGFYIRFSAGTARERAFGQLPEYELFFRGDKFANGKVKKQVNRSTAQYSGL
jgi:hypothetical protein